MCKDFAGLHSRQDSRFRTRHASSSSPPRGSLMPLRAEGTLIVATSEDEASDNVSEIYAIHLVVFSQFSARTNSVRMGLRSPLSLE